MFRSTIARVSRPMATRGYADKPLSETVGDALKSAAKAFSAGDATGDKAGKVGGKFRSDGEVGEQFEDAAGGTFSSQTGGKVGSQFEKDGAVGGTAQKLSDKAWDAGKAVKGEK